MIMTLILAGLIVTGSGQQMSTSTIQSEYQFARTQHNSKRSLSHIAEDFHAMNNAKYNVCSDRDEMGPCTQNFNKKYASLLEETLEHKHSNQPLNLLNAHEEKNLVDAISMAAYYMYSPQTPDPRSLDDLKRRDHNRGIHNCFYDTTRPYYQEIDEKFIVNVHNVKEAGNFELKDITFNDIKKVYVKRRLDPQHNIKIQDLSTILDDCHKHGKTNWRPTGTQLK